MRNTLSINGFGGLLATCLLLAAPSALAAVPVYSVQITSPARAAIAGETFVYTVQVQNVSGTDATKSEISVSLDEDLAVAGGQFSGGRNVKIDNPPLKAGESRTITLPVLVEENAEDREVIRTTVTAGNAYSQHDLLVVNEDDTSDKYNDRAIHLELVPSKSPVGPHDTFEYYVRAMNVGPKRVHGVDVTLELGDHLEFLTASNGGSYKNGLVTWKNLDIRSANDSRELRVALRIADTAKHGDRLEATVSSEGAVLENAIYVADYQENKENVRVYSYAMEDEAVIGEELHYVINIDNIEHHDERVDVLAFIDARTQFVNASDDALLLEKFTVRWDDVIIAQNQTKTLLLTVRVKDIVPSLDPIALTTEAGRQRIQDRTEVNLRTTGILQTDTNGDGKIDESDAVEEDDETNDDDGTTDEGVLSIRTVASASEAQPGTQVRATITVTNGTAKPLKNLDVRESFPREQVRIEDAGQGRRTPFNIHWTIDELAAGAVWTGEYTFIVDEDTAHGTVIQTTTEVRPVGGEKGPVSGFSLNVITQLPAVGAALTDIDDTTPHYAPTTWRVIPVAEAKSVTAATPVIGTGTVWTVGLLLLGLGLAVGIGLRNVARW